MAAELPVLGDDDGERQRRRHLVQRHPYALDPRARHPTPQHQRRDRAYDEIEKHQETRKQDQCDENGETPPQEADGTRACSVGGCHGFPTYTSLTPLRSAVVMVRIAA